ncbi:acyl carrier protein [Streptomyces sp. NPDC020362]|uniref:acyl carrier protein n=1 Tax=unclassified Streptomyces TaxID=2593676 RepID=UPI000A7ABEB3
MTTATSLQQALIAFQVSAADITDAATLTELGLDSLAVVELIDTLAAELDRPLADDTLHPAMTVAEAIAALERGGAA